MLCRMGLGLLVVLLVRLYVDEVTGGNGSSAPIIP